MQTSIANHNVANYFKQYIDLAKSEEPINAMEIAHQHTNELMDLITEEQGDYSYAEEKWSIKELLVHLIDMERIFCNRALRIARNDKTDLPGYDHNDYISYSEANNRNLCDIIKEYNLVRKGTLALFNSFSETMLNREGTANNNKLTVLAIGFIIAGHETHHINVMEERYLN